jgi:hypothetical protein
MLNFLPMSVENNPSVLEWTISNEQQRIKRKDATTSEPWDTPLRYYAEQHLLRMSDEELDKDWKLNDFFGTIVVINLPQARERLEKITHELLGVQTKLFKFFPAIDGSKDLDPSFGKKFHNNIHHIDKKSEKGRLAIKKQHQAQAGCYMSHYKLIRTIKESFDMTMAEFLEAKLTLDEEKIKQAESKLRQSSKVLILEDDSGFGILNKERTTISKKGVGKLLREALKELPNDWDLLYFVVQAIEPTIKHSPHLYQLKRSWSAAAYAVNYTMYDSLVGYLKKIEDPAITNLQPVDNEISSIHHLYKVYAIYPSIVFNQAGSSYITDKNWSLWQGQPVFSSPKKPSKHHKKKVKEEYKRELNGQPSPL